MTCKDCVHYRVCYYHDFDDCEWFECKSTFAHMPCKAGDVIFLPWEWYGENGIATITVLRVVLTECESYIETDFDSDDYDYFMKYNCGRFWFGDFGKIVFTTKEEAEEALAERNKKR